MSDVLKVLLVLSLAAVVVLAALLVVRIPAATVPAVQAAPASQSVIPGGQQTGISVSGTGQVKARPDVVYINLGVSTIAQTARGAMDENNAALAAAIAKLKELGVAEKDMQTGSINLTPQTKTVPSGDTSTTVITGYSASNTLTVTLTDLAKAGAVLDAAISAGVNTVGGVRFGILNDAKLQEAALTAAMKDARTKADTAAAGLGLKVTGVESVSVDSTGTGGVVRAYAVEAMGAANASVPIEAGELTYRANVRVTFKF